MARQASGAFEPSRAAAGWDYEVVRLRRNAQPANTNSRAAEVVIPTT